MLKKTQQKLKLLTKHVGRAFLGAWLIYALYLILLASPQYESQSQLIIKKSDGGSAFDASSLLMSSVTDAPLSTDSVLIEAFIKSQDMYRFLIENHGMNEHFQTDEADIFSRLSTGATTEDKYQYYLDHIDVTVDSSSAVITLQTKAFSAAYANTLNTAIIKHAEDFINNINNQLAKSKLKFAKSEHDIVEQKLQSSKQDLLEFQSKYNVLDPTAEGAASQQIAFSLEATLAQKRAELQTMSGMMSDIAPEMRNLKRQIKALQESVEQQKSQLNTANIGDSSDVTMTQLMAQYSDMQIQLQLAIQAYSSSLMTLENTRVETYQKLQHLITVERPTLPESNKYPQIIYNLVLFGVILCLIYAVGRIIVATIKEL